MKKSEEIKKVVKLVSYSIITFFDCSQRFYQIHKLETRCQKKRHVSARGGNTREFSCLLVGAGI